MGRMGGLEGVGILFRTGRAMGWIRQRMVEISRVECMRAQDVTMGMNCRPAYS